MPSSKPSANLPVLSDASVDKNLMAKLPFGSQVVSTTAHGKSEWATPVKIDINVGNDVIERYFVKITSGDIGQSMARGEFESMSMLHACSPELMVRPLAWGKCSSSEDTYFFLSEYHDMGEVAPDVEEFCVKVANLHLESAKMHEQETREEIKGGNYGFHVTTHLGMLPLDNRWCDSWVEFFRQAIRRILAFEEKTQGPSEELNRLASALINEVIPRLLVPLDTEGRRIRPTLIHGDLQIRNARTDLNTGKAVVFDAGSFWGHNECEIGKWRPAKFGLGRHYMDEYHKYIPRSAPEEEWEDRIVLYCIRVNLLSSAHYPLSKADRNMALEDMRYLVEKYARS